MANPTQSGSEGEGACRVEPWDAEGLARVAASGDDPRGVVQAALDGMLAFVLDGLAPPSDTDDTAAAPIAGQGPDLATVTARLADDLLAQLDLFGGGLRHARLDGLLRTDSGGYSGWGYLVGRADGPAVPSVALAGEPVVGRDVAGRLEIRFALRRG